MKEKEKKENKEHKFQYPENQAIHTMTELEEPLDPIWKRVEDGLPPLGRPVLVYCPNGGRYIRICLAYLDYRQEWKGLRLPLPDTFRPTYWTDKLDDPFRWEDLIE